MTIHIDTETDISDFKFDPLETAQKVVEAVLDLEECPYEAEVDILLTDDEAIHQMNLEQRGIDRATDVLSFPMTDFSVPGNFDFLEEDGAFDSFHPETGELLLGDIVLSADRIRSQAVQYGHSVRREYAFLVAHSMFHLIGYDHMEPEDAKIMEKKQRDVLSFLGITRDE